MPSLFLVGTPIGNLEDISLRALRILGEVKLIAAEDTRVTGHLLKHYGIETPMLSYHDYSDPERVRAIIQVATEADVAMVTDAGMPGLSDPGYRLVQAAIEAGLDVIPIPGPSAVISALVSSGLPTDQYLFMGFLPRQQKARRAALATVASLPCTLVLFEAPHRLLALLDDLQLELGDRPISIGRELTKLFEETWRGTVSEAAMHFGSGKIRGELTLVIAGNRSKTTGEWPESDVRAALEAEIAKGTSRKEAVGLVAKQSGWQKRDVYKLALGR